MTRRPVRVEIVLDVICSHSYLGYTRFARAAARARSEGAEVLVSFLPFELAPGASTEGWPLLAVLERSFGPDAVAATAHLAESAALEGVVLDYGSAIATGTFEAHRLIAAAARQGRAEQVVERLFRAHFTDGLHIGDPATLAELAAEAGVTSGGYPPEVLRAELQRVRGLGVTGVPVFRVGGLPPLTGSQSENALYAALTQARERK
ncbi:DsbA family oxidoreductase [Nonomuraea longicatena]|uniref:DsbA family protein n=1 Tax=Nonomuraea longicatena TaxID=83682 RepID=A0ABP4A684_9ACTN